jgi:hypothetical protein
MDTVVLSQGLSSWGMKVDHLPPFSANS